MESGGKIKRRFSHRFPQGLENSPPKKAPSFRQFPQLLLLVSYMRITDTSKSKRQAFVLAGHYGKLSAKSAPSFPQCQKLSLLKSLGKGTPGQLASQVRRSIHFLTLPILQKPDISILVRSGHFYFGLT